MRVFLILLIFVSLIFVRNLAFWSNSQTFVFGDTAIYSLQLASLAKNLDTIFSPKDSIFLWNPNYLSVGLPTLSLVDYGIFYPPNLFIAWLANIFSQPILVFSLYRISILLHLVFGAFFIYKILKQIWNLDVYAALIGALVWIYNGFNLEWIAAAPILLSGSFLPVCLYLILRSTQKEPKKYLYLFYLLLSLSFLVGYPLISVIIYLVCLPFPYILNARTGGLWQGYLVKDHLVGFFLILLPIISPLYFSSFLNLSYSVRNQLKLESFLQNPAPLLDLPEPFLPKNTLFNTLNKTNSVYLYFSLVGLLVLFQSGLIGQLLKDKKNTVLLTIGALGLVFSLGSLTFLPSLAYFMVPGMSLFRRLSIFTIVPVTVFALGVGQAVGAALSRPKFSKIIILWVGILSLLFLYIKVLSILYAAEEQNPFNQTLLYQSLFLSILVTGVTLSSFFYARTYPTFARYLLVVAILVEAGTNVFSKVYLNSKIDPEKIFRPNRLTAALQKIVKPTERVDLLVTQHSYSTDYLNLEQTQGYLSLASQYGVEINEALNSESYHKNNLRKLLGVGYVVKKGSIGEAGLEKVAEIIQDPKTPGFFSYNYLSEAWEAEPPGTSYTIFKNSDILPRVFLAEAVTTALSPSKEEIKKIERRESPRIVTVNQADAPVGDVRGGGQVEIQEYKRNYLKALVANPGFAFLANSTADYPGWWVRVNGQMAKPVKTNWFMMGTYLKPGKNLVEFFYISYGLLIGIVYFLVALVTWVVLAVKNSKTLLLSLSKS